MPPKPQRDYWDANVFLALFQRSDDPKLKEQRENSIRLLDDARKGAAVIVTSAFTIAEARRGDGFPPMPGPEHATIRAFFKHQFIEIVPVDRAIAELAAEYGELFKLNPGDAVQLATAVRSKVSRLLTWDGDFHRKIAMRGAPIPVAYPLRPPDPKPPMLEYIEAAEAAAAALSDGEDPGDLDDETPEALTDDGDDLTDDLPDEGSTDVAEEADSAVEKTSPVGQATQDGAAVRGRGQAPAEHAPAEQGPAPAAS